ncbi:shikimate dehydrogenase family protein [Nesterenkonia sandarakina]|uniref:Shikimate dehydrogenase n=1 Tax=Nesterenkonia sandarakina TaxID=272918 RepID=A0A2T0YLJ0_9MICC|nr:shikimate dehydrogenase [Nesterenkonia sandarakina]PRZ16136.1 shikimate dehydrogenase [Nesterenkonia sandarakina]
MTRQAAVLGHPIAHSLSPLLHTAAYEHLGLDAEYRRIGVPEESLQDFLRGEGAAGDWMGWSVTMPLKAAMLSAVDHPSARVTALGVLNTVIHRNADTSAGPQRTLAAENTDVDGIVAALGEAGLHPASSTDRGSFGIIGAGATATAAMAAAAELGYTQVRSYARSIPRGRELEPVAAALGLTLSVTELSNLPRELRTGTQGSGPAPSDPAQLEPADGTPAQLDPADATPVQLTPVHLDAVVSTLPPRAADEIAARLPCLDRPVPLLDVAYDPWPSALARSWEASGGPVVSGLVMLLHQAVKQVELFSASTSTPAAELSEASHAQMVAKMRRSIGL